VQPSLDGYRDPKPSQPAIPKRVRRTNTPARSSPINT
jgi:hypothetical protein